MKMCTCVYISTYIYTHTHIAPFLALTSARALPPSEPLSPAVSERRELARIRRLRQSIERYRDVQREIVM